jgi:hypothetical protein
MLHFLILIRIFAFKPSGALPLGFVPLLTRADWRTHPVHLHTCTALHPAAHRQ